MGSGALGVINAVPDEFRDKVLVAYNEAIVDVFYVALGLTCVVAVSTLGIEWKSVKKRRQDSYTTSF